MTDMGGRKDASNIGGCPKRVWVLTALSDDEATGYGTDLPPLLRLHLSRCEPCRVLAAQMGRTTQNLQSLSTLEPAQDLVDRAHQQALNALRDGARLTGRVAIPEDDPVIARSPSLAGVRARRVGYAVAAGLLMAFTTFGIWALRQPSRSRLADVAAPTATGDPSAVIDATSTYPAKADSPPSEAVVEAGNQADVDSGLEVFTMVRPQVPPMPMPRYYSHVEAAWCDDPRYVHRAVILPRRSAHPTAAEEIGRLLSTFEGFDNPTRSESTGRGPNGG